MGKTRSEKKSDAYGQIKKAVEDHLENYRDYPLTLKIGDSNSIDITADSLRDLNDVFSEYEEKMYNGNKFIFDPAKNPNIATVNSSDEPTIHTLNRVCLNGMIAGMALRLLSDFTSDTKKKYICAPSDYPQDESPIADLELNSKAKPYKKFNTLYIPLNAEHPLNGKLSLEFNYYLIANSLTGRAILNPRRNYKWNPDYDVINKTPIEWDSFLWFHRSEYSDNPAPPRPSRPSGRKR